MVSISSNEINYLIFRYLHESGFAHSAFAFGYEAGINNIEVDGNLIPPGALVRFVQKGFQYLELESSLSCSDAEKDDDDFSLLQPMDLITKDIGELQKLIKEKKKSLWEYKHKEKDKDHEHVFEKVKEEQTKEKERIQKDVELGERKYKDKLQDQQVDVGLHQAKYVIQNEMNGISGGSEPMDISIDTSSVSCEIPFADVTILKGHTSEVFACAWNPVDSLLASGSGDSTARIWAIADGPSSDFHNGLLNVEVLKHFKGRTNEKSKDVSTLDWNCDGTLLATGSYDGKARIWSKYGYLRTTLNKHKGPIFSLKWNKRGDYLLSGSIDKTAVVWDLKTGEWKQQFEFHTAPTLDVDWRNNVSFATCSTDNMIYACKIGENRPIKTFSGHQGEVNAIKWDPAGVLLASCSDDRTAKVWSMKQDVCVHNLRGHTKEIYTIKWSPTGLGSNNPNQKPILASASFDSTIKLWDVELGSLICSLNGHRDPVYSVAFSPSGEYLASGSLDNSVNLWSVKEGRIVKTYSGDGGIFEVCWNKGGDKIAACFANNVVCVLDIRM